MCFCFYLQNSNLFFLCFVKIGGVVENVCMCVSREKVGVYVKNGKEKVASLGVNVFWGLVRSNDGKKVLYVILWKLNVVNLLN